MPIGYSGAPRVTHNNMDARIRRLSRSLLTGNNGTPLKITLLGGANTNLIEELNFEAAPGGANTEARRPVWNVYSTKYRSADNTAVVNAGVIAGSWNTCGFLEVRCHTDNTLIWGVNNTFGGGPGAVVYMSSTGYMKADNTAFSYDEDADTLLLYRDTSNTSPSIEIQEDGIGDAMMRFRLTDGQQWTVGIDNSDNDSFKIQADSVLGADTDNVTILTNATVGIGTSSPVVSGTRGIEISSGTPVLRIATTSAGGRAYSEYANSSGVQFLTGFHDSHQVFKIIPGTSMGSNVGLTINPTGEARLYRNDSGTTPSLKVEQDSTGDAFMNFLLTATAGYAIGIDNSDSDILKILAGNTVNGNVGFNMDSSGRAGLGIGPDASAQLYINRQDITANSFASHLAYIPGGAVDANSTKTFFGLRGLAGSATYDIATGVTDLGNRIGCRFESHVTSSNFQGTLAAQEGLRVSAGHTAGTGTISNSIAVRIQNLSSGSVTLTQSWGIHQSGASAKNFFAGNLGVGIAPQPGAVTFNVGTANTSATPNMWVRQQSSGDCGIRFSLGTSTQNFVVGIDNSDSDKFKIQQSSTFGATDAGFSMLSNQFGFNKSTPSADVHVYANDSSTNPMLRIEQDGTGDATLNFLLTSTQGWSFGIDNDDADRFRISVGNSVTHNDNFIVMTTDKKFGIGAVPSVPLHQYSNDSSTTPATMIEQDGTGDAALTFRLTNLLGVTVGIDNGTNDNFTITRGNTAGATADFVMNTGTNLAFAFGTTPDDRYMIRVLPPTITASTGRSVTAFAPRSSVSANSTNSYVCFFADSNVAGAYDIASGIVDSGSREAFRAESYASNADFLGTLAIQRGLYARTGISTGSGTISNSIGLDLEMLESSGNITQGWGVYQRTANAENYFAGNTGIGAEPNGEKLRVYRNDTSVVPQVTVEQDSTGDASVQFLLTGGQAYSFGIDNSDSDKFKFTFASNLSSNEFWSVDTTGHSTLEPVNNTLTLGGTALNDRYLTFRTINGGQART